MSKTFPEIASTDSPASFERAESNDTLAMSSTTPIINTEGISANDIENAEAPSTDPSSCGKSYFCSMKFVEVCICFLFLLVGFTLELADPHERPIPFQVVGDDGEYIRELMYNNEFLGETVPPLLMFGLCWFVPGAVIAAMILCYKPKFAFDKWDTFHKWVCVYLSAAGLTEALTVFCKLYVGYLRPIFYDFCQPDEDYESCSSTNELGSKGSQARVSFPSGHASLSMCGLMLFSFFLDGTFGKAAHEKRMKEQPNYQPSKLFRIFSVLCFSPVLLAYFIAISRVRDNEHHPADVVMGMLLGGTIANFIYGVWFR